MKKILVILILMLTLVSTCLVGCSAIPDNSVDVTSDAAAAVFTLDVNPGVRIFVKGDGTVLSIEATNEDGRQILIELDVKGEKFEDVVETVIDKMYENGYLTGEENSVLISIEKQEIDISDKVNEKIEHTFEKHGKHVSVIEQELDGVDEELLEAISDIAKKHNISEGKAHLIDMIRAEFPELSEEDLANLRVEDLGMILDEASDDVKGHFKKIDKPVEEDYIGREQALAIALESVNLALEDVTMQRVRVTREDGKMVYEAEFVCDGLEYEIDIDAVSGEILETETEEFEEFDPDKAIGDFCDKHNINLGDFNDYHKGDHGSGDGEHNGDHGDNDENKPMSRGEIIRGILKAFEIDEESIKKTDFKIYETENGMLCTVTVEVASGEAYEFVIEAYSGTIIKVTLNGVELDSAVEAPEKDFHSEEAEDGAPKDKEPKPEEPDETDNEPEEDVTE